LNFFIFHTTLLKNHLLTSHRPQELSALWFFQTLGHYILLRKALLILFHSPYLPQKHQTLTNLCKCASTNELLLIFSIRTFIWDSLLKDKDT